MSHEQLARYYSSDYYEGFYEHSKVGISNLPYRARAWVRRRGADRRYRRAPYDLAGVTPGKVLDVGCGSGDLLAHFRDRGWETYGIDPGAASVAAARRRGAQVHEGTLEDQPWEPGSFHLITFQHSLEHIVGPVDALLRARALLAPGGLLIVDVPNWRCWQRLLFRNRWFHLDLPRHQQHFSPRSLQRLASKLGLQVRRTDTTSTAISTSYSVHYVLAGRWTPGWELWLSYALGVLLLPLALLGDRIAGGDCCFIVMELVE
ncbi:MAG TPA: class I SAM-dependent methyltransferase [Solirubrobacteraceae bacterium]